MSVSNKIQVIGFRSQVNGEIFYYNDFDGKFVSENSIDISDEGKIKQCFGNASMDSAKELMETEGNVGDLIVMEIALLSYDVYFNDSENSNNMGFSATLEYCQQYIANHNGTNQSYFADYKGGNVSIICQETEEIVFDTVVK
jgi:hypothetical protein